MARLLVIDDDPSICSVLLDMVQALGHQGVCAGELAKGLDLARSSSFDVVLLDLVFPDGNGLEILPELINTPSSPEVIIITGTEETKGARLAFEYGAWDYLRKPFVLDEVSLSISRSLQYRREKGSASAPQVLNRGRIVGETPAIQRCLGEVAKAAGSDAGVLIRGETGTGKELFARAIHENSRRSGAGFVAVDCGALPESLVESTLFGHEKGAFTGAEKKREGLIFEARGGTLFLDEVGELPLSTQKSLLRTLQERRYRPLGSSTEIQVDFRLVAATNRDLREMVKAGLFREELLFRIMSVMIELPPLRERKEDIQAIAVNQLHSLCQHYQLETKGLSQAFLETLTAYRWPGNVRELINSLEYALASAGDDPTLHPKHLPAVLRSVALEPRGGEPSGTGSRGHAEWGRGAAFPTLAEFRSGQEKDYLTALLQESEGDRHQAVRLSGLSQSRLYSLLRKHDLPGFKSK